MVMKRLIRPTFAAYESVAKVIRRARWPLTIGVRVVVRDEDKRVLLVRHTYSAGWHFPGGGVNKRETAVDAAVREVREETQIELMQKPALVGVFLNLVQIKCDHIMLFEASTWRRVDEKPPNMEIAEARFFAENELPSDASGGTVRRLAELAGRQPQGTMW
ncbi:MAG: NUDIX domain-containing protein [Alphaproteobacteria bacterium]|nr:NUDIX domain-containing protein [Alphaproteobacteria bacterium]